MGSLGGGELLVLVLLTAVFVGPEHLPAVLKKLARVLRFLRGVANNATEQVKAEIGIDADDLMPASLREGATTEMLTEMANLRAEVSQMRTEFTRLQLRTGQGIGG